MEMSFINNENNDERKPHEKVKKAKDTLHKQIDTFYGSEQKRYQDISRRRINDTKGDLSDEAYIQSEEKKKSLEEEKNKLHLAVELATSKEQYKSIWNKLVEFFAKEEKKAEEKGDSLRLEELRDNLESAKNAFNEILQVLDELRGISGSEPAKEALEDKLEEVKDNVIEEMEKNGNKGEETVKKYSVNEFGEIEREGGDEDEETTKEKEYTVNAKNEAIRKIEGNDSAKMLLVLLEDGYLPDNTEYVDVKKMVERILKEYSSVDELEIDLQKAINEKLNSEQRMKHRWDGFPVLIDSFTPLYDKRREASNSERARKEEKTKENREVSENLLDKAVEELEGDVWAKWGLRLLFLAHFNRYPDRKSEEERNFDVKEVIKNILQKYPTLDSLQSHLVVLIDGLEDAQITGGDSDMSARGARMILKDNAMKLLTRVFTPLYEETSLDSEGENGSDKKELRERFENVKTTIHRQIDAFALRQQEVYREIAKRRLKETNGNSLDTQYLNAWRDIERIEKMKNEIHEGLENAKTYEDFKAILDKITAIFDEEKKKAQEAGDTERVKEIEERYNTIGNAFDEIFKTIGIMNGIDNGSEDSNNGPDRNNEGRENEGGQERRRGNIMTALAQS